MNLSIGLSGMHKIVLFILQSQYATPLLLAASGGHKEVVEVLIANGASASDEDAVRENFPHFPHFL